MQDFGSIRRVDLHSHGKAAADLAIPEHFEAYSVPYPNAVTFKKLHFEILDWCMSRKLSATRDNAARMLVIQGEPGSGKTITTANAITTIGAHACPVPADYLASPEEAGHTQALKEHLQSVVHLSECQQRLKNDPLQRLKSDPGVWLSVIGLRAAQ